MAMDAKTIAVALKLETGQFTAGLGMAAGQVKAFSNDVTGAAGKVGKGFQDAAAASDKHLKQIGTVGLIVGGAIVAGFGMAVMAATAFDKQMSEVGAVAGATGEELGKLRTAAIQAGAATVFSAGEAAKAESELAKAGVSTADILSGGLYGALNLASAGNLDLGMAATFAANAMTTFKLSGSDVPRIADALAAGANKSAAEVDDMGMSLQQSGLVANQMGLSLEDTVGTLSMFAQAGLRGSDAGTSLKTMLMRLTPQSAEASGAMETLGLKFYDALGNFVGITKAAQLLQDKLTPLSQEQRQLAMQTIFGSDAIRGATILYESGAKGVDYWRTAVSESGYAAELARQKNNNLSGDLEQLKGSFETVLIQGGSKATGVLRGLAGAATDVLNGFGAMPGPMQSVMLGFTGLVGIGAAGIGIYGTLAPKLGAVKIALNEMGSAGSFVAANMGTIALGAAGVGIALVALSWAFGQAAKEQAAHDAIVKDYTEALTKQTGALDDNVRATTAKKFADGDIGKTLKGTSANLTVFANEVTHGSRQMIEWSFQAQNMGANGNRIKDSLRGAAAGGNQFASELMRLYDSGEITDSGLGKILLSMHELNNTYGEATEKAATQSAVYDALGISADGAGAATAGMGTKVGETSTKFEDQKKKVDDATQALKGYFDQTTSPLSALIDFETKIDDLTASIQKNGNTWDIDTEAGRANTSTLIDAKGAAIAHGIEVLKSTGSVAEATAATMGHVNAMRNDMVQAGLTDGQIATLLNTMGLTPAAITTQFTTVGLAQANTDASTFQRVVTGLDGSVITVKVSMDSWEFWSNAGAVDRYLKTLTREQQAAAGATMAGAWADGGVVDYYAQGGITAAERFANGSENHVAQIAAAGSMRIWAEPETGGEAYIPLAQAKRPRSVAILGAVASRFGYGLTDGSSTGSTTHIREGDTNFKINVPPSQVSPYQIAESVMFKMAVRGR